MNKLATAFALLLALGAMGCKEAKVTKRLKAANHYAEKLCACTDDACKTRAAADFASVLDDFENVELGDEDAAELEAMQNRVASCSGAAPTGDKAN